MRAIIKIIVPIFILIMFFSSCLPTESARQSAVPSDQSSGSSSGSTLISPRKGLRVYTGNLTSLSENEFIVQTIDVTGKNYAEAYFDFPYTVQKPFFISFEIDYPVKSNEDTIELIFSTFSYGFVPQTSEHWLAYTDKSFKSKYWKFSSGDHESAKLKQNNLVYIFRPDTFDPQLKFYVNHIYQFNEGLFNITKNGRIGFKIRSKKGQSQKAVISNIIIASGPVAQEAFNLRREEGKSISDGYHAQFMRNLNKKIEEGRKKEANKPPKSDPIAEAIAARDERRRQKQQSLQIETDDMLGYILTGMFKSIGDYLLHGAPSIGGDTVRSGARAILICNDYEGIERETGVSIPCSAADTYNSCSDKLAEELRRSGYDYVSSYCDIENPNPGFFSPDTISRHGYITIH